MSVRLFGGERREWWTLAAVSAGLFMTTLDNTVVNVALPKDETPPAAAPGGVSH